MVAIRRGLLFLPAVLLMAAFVVSPAFDLVMASVFDPDFTTAHFHRLLTRGVYVRTALHTVQVSIIVAAICALVGYPVAFFIYLQPRHLQRKLIFLILIPFWMSILVRTYAWMVVLGREGIVNSILQWMDLTAEPLQLLFTTPVVFLAMVQILLPIQIMICFSAMSEIDFDLMRAARILGARPREAMLRVFIPLSLEGTLTGLVIVFMLSMGFFITPALLGGPQDAMIGNLITDQVERVNWPFAASIALFLLVLTMGMIAVLRLGGRFAVRRLMNRGSA